MNTPAIILPSSPERCVIVINQQLAAGHAANAAAVLALTLGQRHPSLVGAPLIDADNREHPGLIPIGISVLVADAQQLTQLHQHLLNDDEMDGIIFPMEGQQTTFLFPASAMPSSCRLSVGTTDTASRNAA